MNRLVIEALGYFAGLDDCTGCGCNTEIAQSALDSLRMDANPASPCGVSEMQTLIKNWADSVYPNRTAQSALTKMVMEEIPELIAGGIDDPLEFADIAILLFDAAALLGIDIEQAVKDKMAINVARRWKIDAVTGIMKHVKE
jgi:hypothetical protein